MTCRRCGAIWCYDGDHEPGDTMPAHCPVCRCTEPGSSPKRRYPTEAAALATVRAANIGLERAYPCGGHWHTTSQVRPGIRLRRRGQRGSEYATGGLP